MLGIAKHGLCRQGCRPVALCAPRLVNAVQHVSRASAPPTDVRRRLAARVAATGAPSIPDVYSDNATDPETIAFQEHQKHAARATAAEDARTIISLARTGVLATISSGNSAPGFPQSSVIEFAVDEQGLPFFATSTLSPHTADLQVDGRVALTALAPTFKSLQDGRVTLQGMVVAVAGEDEKAALKDAFMKKHPDAFYVGFGDFRWFRMVKLLDARYNGGFGQARKMSVTDYTKAQPDPVAQYSGPVCGHMNVDHEADTISIIKHYVGITVDHAKLLDIDRLGMNAEVTRKGASFKLRLPFPRAVEDRKSIKDAIVEMTKATRAAQALSARQAGAGDPDPKDE